MEEGWAEEGVRCCIQGHMAAECKSHELHTQPMVTFRPGHDIMRHTCYCIISLFFFWLFLSQELLEAVKENKRCLQG